MKLKNVFAAGAMAATLLFAACNKDNNDDDQNMSDLNAQDTTFLLNVYQSNNAEISTSTLALARGTDDSVKMYAQMMIDHHTMAQTNLRNLVDSVNATVNFSDSLDMEQRGMRDSLMMLSGPAFDSSYIAGQVRSHQKTLTVFDAELSNGQNTRVKNFANVNRPIIESHLNLATSIYGGMQ